MVYKLIVLFVWLNLSFIVSLMNIQGGSERWLLCHIFKCLKTTTTNTATNTNTIQGGSERGDYSLIYLNA